MYVVHKAYDDNTAIIMDISSMGGIKFINLTEKELISLGNREDVLGLSVSGQKLNYLSAYQSLYFPSEDEADEYIKDNSLSYKNKRYIQGMWWIFEKRNTKIHVDYYIVAYAGDNITYVAERGYTQYIQSAISFSKKEAGEKAALMTQNSKTGKHWTILRVPVE